MSSDDIIYFHLSPGQDQLRRVCSSCVNTPSEKLQLVLYLVAVRKPTLTFTQYRWARKYAQPLLLPGSHYPPAHLPLQGRQLDSQSWVPLASSEGGGWGASSPLLVPSCKSLHEQEARARISSDLKLPGRNSKCANLGSSNSYATSHLASSGAQLSGG